MNLTEDQRKWIRDAIAKARAENCWCIVHNPETDEHNSMPPRPGKATEEKP